MAYYIMYNIGRKYLISWVIFMGCYAESWVACPLGMKLWPVTGSSFQIF